MSWSLQRRWKPPWMTAETGVLQRIFQSLVIYKDVWGSETIPQRICRISYLSIIHRSTKIHEKHCKGSYSQEVTEDKNNMLLSISHLAEDHQDIQQHRCSEAVRTERTKVELPGEKYMLLCLEKNTTYHKAPQQNVKLEKIKQPSVIQHNNDPKGKVM